MYDLSMWSSTSDYIIAVATTISRLDMPVVITGFGSFMQQMMMCTPLEITIEGCFRNKVPKGCDQCSLQTRLQKCAAFAQQHMLECICLG